MLTNSIICYEILSFIYENSLIKRSSKGTCNLSFIIYSYETFSVIFT